MEQIKRFLKEEEGMEMTEYAIVGALVVAAGAGVWVLLGERIQTAINALITSFNG